MIDYRALGMSTTYLDRDDHNSTKEPDLFYFSYIKRGTEEADRIVTFCVDATFNSTVSQETLQQADFCFLGKGAAEWSEVRKWSGAYLRALERAADTRSGGSNRRLLGWWGGGSHKHVDRSAEGKHIGRDIGTR